MAGEELTSKGKKLARSQNDFLVVGELDIELPPAPEFARIAKEWHKKALGLFQEEVSGVLSGSDADPDALRKSGISCGPPHALWAFCGVTVRGARVLRDSSKVFSEKNYAWFDRQIENGVLSSQVGISRLDENGFPRERLARITVERPEEAESWVRLSCQMPESTVRRKQFSDSFLRLMEEVAHEISPAFGHVAYSYSLGKTALEEVLGPPWLLPEETIPGSRTHLRGYGWVTVFPEELLPSVGGVSALRSSGAFEQVTPLRNGGVYLLATPDFESYRGEAIEGVWKALAPALRAGTPKRLADKPGHPPVPVVYRSAGSAY